MLDSFYTAMIRAIPVTNLSEETIRMTEPCRKLAQYRCNLGLTQTRLAVLCIVASLDLSAEPKLQFAQWMIRGQGLSQIGDTKTIGLIESGRLAIAGQIRADLNRIGVAVGESIDNWDQLRSVREKFNISQTRLAAIALVVSSNLEADDRQAMVRLIIENQYVCPVGNRVTIANLETGGHVATSEALKRSVVAGLNLAFVVSGGRLIGVQDLFENIEPSIH